MTDTYRIRRATLEDVPALPGIEREAGALFEELQEELGLGSLGEVNTVDAFRAAQEAERLWVAADGGDRPVGFALVLEIDEFAHLDELDVSPSHGRRGLGASLLEAVCDWARDAGYPGVTLSTFRDVPWNAPFYERHGFRIMAPAELSRGLTRVVEGERRKGLRIEARAIMRRELTPRK